MSSKKRSAKNIVVPEGMEPMKIPDDIYEKELYRLQGELVKLQRG